MKNNSLNDKTCWSYVGDVTSPKKLFFTSLRDDKIICSRMLWQIIPATSTDRDEIGQIGLQRPMI